MAQKTALVRLGMYQALADVNTAYCEKKLTKVAGLQNQLNM
jgi:hypothetical protein